MSVESRRKQREPKTETEKALMAQKTKEGLQGLAIGPVTGLLGLPSDIIDLADIANDAIAKYGADTTIAQFSKLIKPQLDAVQEKYGRDAFDKGFTELTGIKSDPTKPAQFLGELVSLGGVAKTGVKGAKLVGETISDTYKGAKKLFEDSTLPPPDNLAAQTAGAGQFKQTDTLLDKTKSDTSISTEIPSLKTEDLANKPTINPSIIGVETELGQKQIASYEKLIKDSKVLGGKPPSPQRLFERTGVYKGSDGKYRYDLDDRDAEFNTSFLEKSLVKNPNMKNPPIMLSNSIVSYRHLQPKLFTLREVLDFDSLYKQYPKTLKVKDKVYSNIGNVKVKFISGKSGTRGSYDGDTDTITLNITDSSGQQITDLGKIESTLLHEVQHAIQRREGFLRGGNNETMLDKINPNHSKELKEANDELSNKLTLLKDNLSTGFDNIQPFKHTDGNTYNSTEAINYAAGQISKIAYAKALKDKDAVKILEENISSFLENSNFPKGIQQKITKNADNIFFDIQVKRSKLDKETRQSFEEYENLYGEKEARLVQKRYEKRKKFKAMSGGLDFGEDKITNIMRKDTSFIDDMTKKGQIGILTNNINEVSQSANILEKTPVKKSPALQKISEITKLRDGTLGSRTPIDKDGLPKDLIRDKDGKPLVLYYGDMGQVYDPITQTYKASDIPGKLTNKFAPSGRTYTIDKKVGNFVTPNPVFASGYASQEGGSVIPVYLIADKVSNIKARSFSDIDKAGGDAKRGEVFIGDVGYDSAAPVKLVDGRKVKDVKARDESIKKYGTEQYTFNRGTQVFSAITGERLTNLPTIDQNIRNKLLKLTQKEEDVLLKKMSPEERIKYKAKKTYTEDLIDDTDFVEDMFKLDRKGDITRNEKKRNLAKGGDMKKQMDLFQEGGLKDEGGTVDPVSGNDVPPGSTQEEVRDDIPAQLSEGEFVFPADVVRFIGLEKLMTLRQEAKAGLKRMEEMGQMGNSEEATLPDDMPFTIDDLDMEDEEEYNTDTQEMNQGGMVRVGGVEMQKPRIAGQQFADGGVVQAQSGTFVAPGSGVTTIPSQFAGQNLPSYKPNETIQSGTRPAYTVPIIPSNVSNFRQLPIAQTGQQQIAKTPSFEDLLGKNPGQYDELREYVNDAGMKLRIPFKNGQPIYPIPEGYKFVDPEEEQTETPTVQSVRPTTTQAQVDGDNDSGTRVGTTMVGKTGKGITDKSLSTNQKTGMVMSALDKATTKGNLGVALQTLGTLGVPGAAALGGFDSINPDRTALDDVLGQYGYNATTANAALNDPMAAIGLNQQQAANMANSISQTELSSPAVQEALSQAMYGMSKAQATSMLGVSPTTTLGTKGYKNGQVDPTTNGTYAYGQSTNDDGDVSYGSIDDFGIGMAAMSATGFMGGLKDAERVAEKGKTEKARQRALNYISFVKARSKQKEQAKKDEESTRGGTGDLGGIGDLGSGYGIGESTGPGSQTMGTEDVDPTSGGTATGSGATAGSPSGGGVSTADDSTGVGSTGDADSPGGGPGGAATEGVFKQGGLAKRKTKVKKMKRGGLASR